MACSWASRACWAVVRAVRRLLSSLMLSPLMPSPPLPRVPVVAPLGAVLSARAESRERGVVGVEKGGERGEVVGDEVQVGGDDLNRSVDFVGDPGGEMADGF
jgi:hypothetical protein